MSQGAHRTASRIAVAIGACAAAFAVAVLPLHDRAEAAFPGEDGRIAYMHSTKVDADRDPDIFTILPDGSGRKRLTDTGDSATPSWSADGRRLVFVRGDGRSGSAAIRTMDADGGEVRRVVEVDPDGLPLPSFSPDGRCILYTEGSEIRTIGVDGTDPRTVLRTLGDTRIARYSPNGRRILFIGRPLGAGEGGIWTARADGTGLRNIASEANDYSADYSPDGRRIVVLNGEGVTGYPVLDIMRSDGSDRRSITSGGITSPVFSPTGKQIAIAASPHRDALCLDIYTVSIETTGWTPVAGSCDSFGLGTFANVPSWQPIPGPPSSKFKITGLDRDRRHGTARLQLEVPGAGVVRLSKAGGVERARKRMPVAGPVTLRVKPRRKLRRRLRDSGAANVRAKLIYDPDGAKRNTKSKRIRLKRRG